MVQIGEFNQLEILEISKAGVVLDGGEDGEILLPRRLAGPGIKVGQLIDVFVYYSSQDELVATTEKPFACVGEFAYLEVIGVRPVGASLDWGLEKDLFLPTREQMTEPRVGQWLVVFIFIDEGGRITASMKEEDFIDSNPGIYRAGDRVELLISRKSDLGYNAIINNRHVGVIYANEIFKPIQIGDRVEGFIKKVREDGKIDLSLAQAGHRDSGDIGHNLLQLLTQAGGFLPLNDKTSAEEIYDLVGVSKKKFKMAVGGLLKKGLIRFERDGIQKV